MILQALTQYYEDLQERGKIARPGWIEAKVDFALNLDDDGQVIAVMPLQENKQQGKKTVLVSRKEKMPSPVKRSSGVAANFLCDTSSYLLGVDAKGKPKRSQECFAAAKKLHLELLKEVHSPAACAVRMFFEKWQPEQAATHPALQTHWDDLMKAGNLTFWFHGGFVTEDEDICQAWQQHYSSHEENENAICLVTGKYSPVARLHPSIKGVVGAQSSGASLVSFHGAAFCSYGHEQGSNSPVSEYAAFAYTSALNQLIADREHVYRLGDTTVVCWAVGAQDAPKNFMNYFFNDAPDVLTEQDFRAALSELSKKHAYNWNEQEMLEPSTPVYILGLAPNAARLSVRFFWRNTLQTLADHVNAHYERMKIIRPSYEPFDKLSVKSLLRETVNLKARTPEPDPRLAGDLMLAILNDNYYPATLLNGVELRIRADHKIDYGRACILKAYFTKNSQNEQLKEVLTVELNEQSEYLPYILGRLFAVLEEVQDEANHGINTTIKDRYFNSASATPRYVFPTLINLAQKHLAKLKDKQKVYYNYNKKITGLISKIHEEYPPRMTLEQQGAFQIGYYHQTQARYTKKEETENV